MANKSSNKTNSQGENGSKDASQEPVKQNINDQSSKQSEEVTSGTTEDDCIDQSEKNQAVVEKMFNAAPVSRTMSSNCKCIKKKGKLYCFRLRQGAWVQASGVAYPSKEICEENNCFE